MPVLCEVVVVLPCHPLWTLCVFLSNTKSQASWVLVSSQRQEQGTWWGTSKCLWVFLAISAIYWCKGVTLSLDLNVRLKIITVTGSGSHWHKNSGSELKLWMSSYNWVQGPLQENKDTNGLAVTVSYPQWVRDPFIHHQQIPLQMWGHFLPGGKVLTSILKPPEWQFKGWLQTATAPHCQTIPLETCHFFLSPPKDARKCDLTWDTRWINGLTKVAIYPTCTNQHQMIVVLAALIQGPSGSKVVSYLVTCKQQKKTNLRSPGHPGALTTE